MATEGKSVEQATIDGLVTAWGRLPDVPIIAIRDNPSVPTDNLACVEKHRDDAARQCSVPRSEALLFDGQAAAAERVPRATVLDFTPFYCTTTSCAPVIGHVLVYRDTSHLTRTYTKTIAPYVNARVVAALA